MNPSDDLLLLRSLLVLGSVIEARDAYTGGHAWRVAQYAKLLAERAGLGTSEAFVAALGGFVHDLGKVGIPDSILLKSEALNAAERATMNTHPDIGSDLLTDHPLAALVHEAVKRHHERFDGEGYPGGLRSEELAAIPRLVSVADAFDAMTSTRPYRKGLPQEEALRRLLAERNRQFDGSFVDPMVSLARNGALNHVLGHSDHETPLVHCMGCGPVIAVPRSAEDGDEVHCPVCLGRHRLHASGETFEAEFLNEKALARIIRPELEQIHGLLREAPDRLEI